MKVFFQIMFFIAFALNSYTLCQTQIEVKNPTELKEAIAKCKTGGVINLLPGEYDFTERIIVEYKGSKEAQLIIKPKKYGSVKFIGNSWFTVKNSNNVTIEGFVFESTNGPAVEVLGSSYTRVNNNIFRLKETKNSSWIYIGDTIKAKQNASHHNRIDHNLFENKKLLGNFITIEGTLEPEFQVSQYDKIDNNYFRNIGPRVENVLEAIRVGSSYVSLSSGFTLIEKNLFEKCHGDPEVVSVKSSDDTIRYNTFRECLGVLSLRHGNRSTIDGNYFLGNGRTGEFIDSTKKKWILGTGGVRLYGDNMKVINNYFEGLTGEKWDASLALTSGNADYGTGQPLTKHYRTRYSYIAFNTFINNKTNIEVGYDGGGFQNNWWKLPPTEITIANNIVSGSKGKLINVFTEPINTVWLGNLVSPIGEAVLGNKFEEAQVKEIKLNFEKDGEVWKLNRNDPARKLSVGNFLFVKYDIEGQLRGNNKEPGCDQNSNTDALNKPLTKNDVGPFWYKDK